jgi:hypothetical protein
MDPPGSYLRITAPRALVDINGIDGLDELAESGEGLAGVIGPVGGMTVATPREILGADRSLHRPEVELGPTLQTWTARRNGPPWCSPSGREPPCLTRLTLTGYEAMSGTAQHPKPNSHFLRKNSASLAVKKWRTESGLRTKYR